MALSFVGMDGEDTPHNLDYVACLNFLRAHNPDLILKS